MINWKVRLKNRAFWLSAIPAALLLAQTVAALFGAQWDLSAVGERLLAVVNALFALLSVLGVVVDPTTQGLPDSPRALTYQKPQYPPKKHTPPAPQKRGSQGRHRPYTQKTPMQTHRDLLHGEAEYATSELFAWMAADTSFSEKVSVPSLKL